MAKARAAEAPTQNDTVADRPSQTESTVVSPEQDVRIVQIDIPVTLQPPPTEFVFHVDCKLTPQQSTVARRIAQQLDRQNACLNNGQRIVNVHGALKWLLERLGGGVAYVRRPVGAAWCGFWLRPAADELVETL